MEDERPDLQRFPWLGGHPALNFSNTIEWVDGEVDVEWLGDYRRLIEWMRLGGLMDFSGEHDLRTLAARHHDKANEFYADAIALRDAILAICIERGRDSAALATINGFVTKARSNQKLYWYNDQFVWSYADADLRMPLWRLAEETAALLTSPDFSRVRQCAADDCSYLFVDTSRTGKRRWCDMATCGNRAKARRHSSRKRS